MTANFFRFPRTALTGLVTGLVTGLALMPVVLIEAAAAAPVKAVPTAKFLDSIGIVTTFPDRGQPLDKTIEMIKFCGFRWVRGGIEGLTDDGPTTIQTFLDLNRETGAKISWGLVSGGTDLDKLISTASVLAQAGALLAIEGNNEPNNWGVTYQGEEGGGAAASWMAVAKLQRDLYQRVKSDPLLKGYPVWSISEPGAQRDNVGLQFLTIPKGAGTLMPDGTTYADYANVHNYIYHPKSPHPTDNKVWDAADPSAASPVDGLYGNFGSTWGKWFPGYDQKTLDTLPRVTTETGVTTNEEISEHLQAVHLTNVYLAQFKRGYSHTSVYLLRDRTDETGNQSYGYFGADYQPRKAAVVLRNFTTILADATAREAPGALDFTIRDQPKTVHELLLQRSDGAFQLVVWGERLQGEDRITVRFAKPHGEIAIYDPLVGVEPIQTLQNVDSLELQMSDHPIILTLR